MFQKCKILIISYKKPLFWAFDYHLLT